MNYAASCQFIEFLMDIKVSLCINFRLTEM